MIGTKTPTGGGDDNICDQTAWLSTGAARGAVDNEIVMSRMGYRCNAYEAVHVGFW
jgi:hypothetical protein